MPDIPGLLFATLLNGGLIQYPNSQTYNAAKLLRPEERPTVPVRVVEPTDYYQTDSAKSGRVNAFVPKDHSAVYVSERSNILNDPIQLAAALAHEQWHISKGDGETERPAYELQYQVLKRLGGNKYYDQEQDLKEHAEVLKFLEDREAARAKEQAKRQQKAGGGEDY